MSLSVHASTLLLALLLAALLRYTSAAGCHVDTAWLSKLAGRSNRDVRAILPAPYCLLLSDAAVQPGSGYFYALDVRNGSVAWRWPAVQLGSGQYALQLLPSARPDRLYAMAWYRAEQQAAAANNTLHTVVAALHSGNGTAMWQYKVSMPYPTNDLPSFAILQPAVLEPALGERLVLAVRDSSAPMASAGRVVALEGSTGRLLSTVNLTSVAVSTIEAVGEGRQGYFTVAPFDGAQPLLQLLQLLPDGLIDQIEPEAEVFVAEVLHSQPVLRYQSNSTGARMLVARDAASNELMWANSDAFLTDTTWGSNATYEHHSAAYQLLDDMPDVFLVLNTAYNTQLDAHNTTLVMQAAAYQLSTGKQLSHSPVLSLSNLAHLDANPTTWQFDDVLLLRGDTAWYTLSLPQLTLVQRGEYATSDAWVASNNWLVDADGSYVALSYRNDSMQGYPPQPTSNLTQARLWRADGGSHRHVRGE